MSVHASLRTPTGRRPAVGPGGRRKRRPGSHEKILLAATELFARQGFHATTVAEIAERVGVSAPAIYRHFRNKQDLLDSALVWVSDLLVGHLEATTERIADPDRRLQTLVGDLVSTLLDEPEFWLIFAREMHNLSPGAFEQCLSARREFIGRVGQVLGEIRGRRDDDQLRIVGALAAMTAIVEAAPKSSPKVASRVATSVVTAALLADVDGKPGC
jgi:AcrR family transcriptional regulator